MSDLISRKYLYDKMSEKEELARQRVLDTPTHSPAYLRYVAQLNERTVLKHEIADAPDVTDTNVGSKWIPCSERMPEPEKEVLLQFENNMVVGFFFVEGGRFDGTTNWYGLADDDCYTDCDAKPIAWQPLPEPYKGE